jgi:hypothetical protein
VISDAVQAYLANQSDPEPERRRDDLDDAWFAAFDERAHTAYEREPTKLARLGAWLRRR